MIIDHLKLAQNVKHLRSDWIDKCPIFDGWASVEFGPYSHKETASMKNMKLRDKLLFTILPVIIIVIGVLTVSSYQLASKTIMQQNEHYLEQMVEKTVGELAFWLEEREREITLLSQDQLLIDASQGQRLEEAQARLVAYQRQSPVYEAVFLTDVEGVILACSNEVALGLDVAKIPEYTINITKAQQ